MQRNVLLGEMAARIEHLYGNTENGVRLKTADTASDSGNVEVI